MDSPLLVFLAPLSCEARATVWMKEELRQCMDTRTMLAELAGMMGAFQMPFAAKGGYSATTSRLCIKSWTRWYSFISSSILLLMSRRFWRPGSDNLETRMPGIRSRFQNTNNLRVLIRSRRRWGKCITSTKSSRKVWQRLMRPGKWWCSMKISVPTTGEYLKC